MAKLRSALKESSQRLRVEGVLLNSHQPIKRALINIRGLKEAKSAALVLRSRLNPNSKVSTLTNEDIKSLRTTFSDLNFSIENVLLRSLSLAKQRVYETRLIRGLRLRKGLTNRGQRTRNNNKTIKRRS